jgi:hypothetical protein
MEELSVLRKTLATVVTMMCSLAFGQAASRNPIQANHIFRPLHSKSRTLEERYTALSCGLVIIQAGPSLGTGFYISPDGDLVTALHVLGTETFAPGAGSSWNINLQHPVTVTIKTQKETFPLNLEGNLQADGDTWGTDVTILKTGKPTECWFKIGDDKLVKTGEHVISLGFPGLAFGSLSLYTGIVSAKLKTGLIGGFSVLGQPLQRTNDLIRVQMPISAGVSGAPVINDSDEVIGVVTQAGASSPDLDDLIQKQRMKDQSGLKSTEPDPLALIAHLAGTFHEFASPGYGDAVPLSYLPEKALQANRKRALFSRPRQ